MLNLPMNVRIFVARDAVDMRKSFDGLTGLVISVIEEDPKSGHLFAFFNARRTIAKLLIWDRSGFWVAAKRIENGVFKIFDRASRAKSKFEIRMSELTLILDGIDLRGARRRITHDEICENRRFGE